MQNSAVSRVKILGQVTRVWVQIQGPISCSALTVSKESALAEVGNSALMSSFFHNTLEKKGI